MGARRPRGNPQPSWPGEKAPKKEPLGFEFRPAGGESGKQRRDRAIHGLRSCPVRKLSIWPNVYGRLAQNDPGGPQLVVQQPALPGEASPVPHQSTVFAHDSVTGDENRQVVSRDQPADLAGVQSGGPRDVIVGAGLTQGDLSKCLEDGNLGRRQIEPAAQVIGVGERPGGPGEVLVQPAGGLGAGTLANVELRHRGPEPDGPLDGERPGGKLATSGPASHSTTVSAPIGELYD